MSHSLSNRIRKNHKHLSKWAKRNAITCYRIYQKDLNDYPLIVDWYDGMAVAWLYERTRDETDDMKAKFIEEVTSAICEGLDLQKAQLFVKHRYRLKGLQTQYEKISDSQVTQTIQENGLSFEVNFTDYLDTGLFLDHRTTREMIRTMSEKKKVLNLFSYTGSFTCYAIKGGAASTTTVDINPNYITWADRNFKLNGITSSVHHRLVVSDSRTYLKETTEKFDIIICDPPTFSNSKRTQEGVWSVDEDYDEMIQLCAKRLESNGTLFFSTNSRRFNLDTNSLSSRIQSKEITHKKIPEDFKHQHPHRCWEVTIL